MPADTFTRKSRPGLLFILLLAVLAISAIAMKRLPMPLVWICFAWAGALFAGVVCLRGPWGRALLFNAGFLAAVLGAVEAYVAFHENPGPVYSERYRRSDDVLGYAPAKGIQAHSSRWEGKRVLYDVKYTIDTNGLRITAPWNKSSLVGTVLFFGCSFTFGEGLEDEQTLPYQVGIQSGGRYRAVNFAFHGYGPHQMLAAIESGRVGSVVDTEPRYAIYTAVPHHVARVAGKVSYGRHAPRYLLTADGGAEQAGHFDDNEPKAPLNPEIARQLDKFAIYRKLSNRDSRVTDDDLRLFLAVVRRSKEMLTSRYPGIEFHVVLWPYYFPQEKPIYLKMQDGLRRLGIRVHVVEDILPGYNADPGQYLLSKGDGHPNALADRMLAQHVLTRIMSVETAAK